MPWKPTSLVDAENIPLLDQLHPTLLQSWPEGEAAAGLHDRKALGLLFQVNGEALPGVKDLTANLAHVPHCEVPRLFLVTMFPRSMHCQGMCGCKYFGTKVTLPFVSWSRHRVRGRQGRTCIREAAGKMPLPYVLFVPHGLGDMTTPGTVLRTLPFQRGSKRI